MYRSFSLIILIILALSCSDNENGPSILTKAPYKSVTDSIRHFPDSAGLYYRRGTLLYGGNEKQLAEQDLRKAWKLQPSENHGLSLTTILKEKNTDSAILFLEQAIKTIPSSIALRVNLANGYKQKGEIGKAISLINTILSDYPNQLDALLLKSEMLKQQEKYSEALTTLEKAYTYAPGDVEVVHMLAFDYAEARNPRALVIADSLIREDTQNSHAEPFYFKGVYYSNTGRREEAIHQFDEAIRRNYNFIDAYVNKGIAFYDMKNYKEAARTFQLAISVSPDEADPYYWLGKTWEAMGNPAEAKLNYQRAYGLDKSLTEAKEAAEKL